MFRQKSYSEKEKSEEKNKVRLNIKLCKSIRKILQQPRTGQTNPILEGLIVQAPAAIKSVKTVKLDGIKHKHAKTHVNYGSQFVS